jgi:hypothetical protein
LIDSLHPEFGAGMGPHRRPRLMERLFGGVGGVKGLDGIIDLAAGTAFLFLPRAEIAAWPDAGDGA